MKNKIVPLMILVCLITHYIFATEPDTATVKIMPFVKDGNYCYKCHRDSEHDKLDNKVTSCDNNCLTCHKKMGKHHPVGVKIDQELPAHLNRLNSKNRLACITCHDLSLKRKSKEVYRSESFFEFLFKHKSEYKTYYLVSRNNNGQLCKACH